MCKTFDVIVVLGMALNKDDSLNNFMVNRLNTTLNIYHQHLCPIIVSGGGAANISESETMKKYLIAHNIPEKDILEESESLDTIGNAYFTKKKYLIPNNWFSVAVVTSQFHIRRSRKIFMTILGEEFSLAFYGAPDKDCVSLEKMQQLYDTEESLLRLKFLDLSKLNQLSIRSKL